MAERSLIQYQPVTGPVWTEPVASRMQWLPQGREFARGLPPNRLGDFARPEFAALSVPAYNPQNLEWIPSDRYFSQALQWARPDWTVFPVQLPAAPTFDPKNLDWVASDRYGGRALPYSFRPPYTAAVVTFDPAALSWQPTDRYYGRLLERRILGDFQQPGFDTLYKPEGLQWMLKGQQPARSIAFIWQGSWIVDPKPVPTIVYDPQFFPFQSIALARALVLPRTLRGDFSTPPLPPEQDVVVQGPGGSSAVHPRRVIYEKGTKRKPKTFIDKIGEPFVELEKTAEPVPDAASAGALPAVNTAPVREALAARLPGPLPLTISTPLVLRPLPEDDEDDDLLLLS